jgi:hypothetical protein
VFLSAWHCRRHHSGQTTRELATDAYLTYGRKFATTLSAWKFRHKICKLKLNRFSKSSKGKIYARCEFALSVYATAMAPVHVQTITVGECHKNSANVVDSTNDFSDLTADHTSCWDMSASCSATDFHEFVARRKVARATLVGLGDMARVSATGPRHVSARRGDLRRDHPLGDI